jgi:hypothetical protein
MAVQKSIAELICADPSLAGLRERLERIALLQRLCRRRLPPTLAASVTVGEPADDELRLYADNGAAAAKLRHLTPELLNYFGREGLKFTGIRVAVQVRASPGLREISPPKQIDDSGLESLARLAESLPEEDLKRAVERLIATSQATSTKRSKM